MTEAPAPAVSGGPVAWLATFVRPQLPALAGALGLALAGTAFSLAQPYLTKLLIDDGLVAGDVGILIGMAAGMVGVGIVATLLGVWNRWVYTRASAAVLFAMREALYRHLQSLSPATHARRGPGDLLSRLDGDIAEIQRFAVDAPLAAINAVILLIGALAMMLQFDAGLAGLAFVLLPAQAAFLRWSRPWIERRTRDLRERAGEISSFLVRSLAAMKLIQAAAAEEREAHRLGRLNHAYLTDLLRLQLVGAATSAVPSLMNSVATAAVFVAGGLMVVDGRMSLGSLIAFTAYLGRATAPVQILLGLYVGWQRARVSLERVTELLAERPAVLPPARPRPLPPTAAGEVVFDAVGFSHAGRPEPVLRGLSLHLPARAKVCLVGASGAGKSTLIDLLHRHYDPDAGQIRLDGVDLRALELGELRRRVAVLDQEAPLVAGSIADNIRFALPEADDAAVERAACAAEIDGFIRALPQGYATPVGEWGRGLSGGQRQRIALARALLADPLVLVLDEPTTAVDGPTAARIVATVDRLFAGRTRLVISHRREALAGADAVYELHGGSVRAVTAAA